MVGTCKTEERSPIGSAIRRGDATLACAELVDMRLRKGFKPLRIGL